MLESAPVPGRVESGVRALRWAAVVCGLVPAVTILPVLGYLLLTAAFHDNPLWTFATPLTAELVLVVVWAVAMARALVALRRSAVNGPLWILGASLGCHVAFAGVVAAYLLGLIIDELPGGRRGSLVDQLPDLALALFGAVVALESGVALLGLALWRLGTSAAYPQLAAAALLLPAVASAVSILTSGWASPGPFWLVGAALVGWLGGYPLAQATVWWAVAPAAAAGPRRA